MYGYLGLFFLSTVNGILVENRNVITEASLQFEMRFREYTGSTNEFPDGVYRSNSPDIMCDALITEPGLTYCDKCLRGTENAICNFAIQLDPKARFRLTLKVEEAERVPTIRVSDGLENGNNNLDAEIEDKRTLVFESTAAAMYIRVDGRRYDPATLSFGFNVEKISSPTPDAGTGCIHVKNLPTQIELPTQEPTKQGNPDCYYKIKRPASFGTRPILISLPGCVKGKEETCYLKYLRLYDGEGINKRRLNQDNDLNIVAYKAKSSVVIMEYFGCRLSSSVNVAFDV